MTFQWSVENIWFCMKYIAEKKLLWIFIAPYCIPNWNRNKIIKSLGGCLVKVVWYSLLSYCSFTSVIMMLQCKTQRFPQRQGCRDIKEKITGIFLRLDWYSWYRITLNCNLSVWIQHWYLILLVWIKHWCSLLFINFYWMTTFDDVPVSILTCKLLLYSHSSGVIFFL